MIRSIAAILAFVSFGTSATAQTVTFEADSDVVFVRAYTEPMMGTSIVEFVAPRNGMMNCFVTDKDGNILAAGPVLGQQSMKMIEEFDTDAVVALSCRYVD